MLTAVLLWPIQATETISELSFLREPLRVEAAARVGDLEHAANTLSALEDELALLEPELASLN